MLRNTALAALLVVGLTACVLPQPAPPPAPVPAQCEVATTEDFMNLRLSQFPDIVTLLKIDNPTTIATAQDTLRKAAGPDASLRDFDTIIVMGVPNQQALGIVFLLGECFQGEHVAPAPFILQWLEKIGALTDTPTS